MSVTIPDTYANTLAVLVNHMAHRVRAGQTIRPWIAEALRLPGADINHLEALITMCVAQIDPDRPLDERTAWIRKQAAS